MKNRKFDPRETSIVKSEKSASLEDVQHLVSVVLPHRYCEAHFIDYRSMDRTVYIHLHPEFDHNPKTALMRAQMADQSKIPAELVGKFLTNRSVVQQKLSLDMLYFWQYGE